MAGGVAELEFAVVRPGMKTDPVFSRSGCEGLEVDDAELADPGAGCGVRPGMKIDPVFWRSGCEELAVAGAEIAGTGAGCGVGPGVKVDPVFPRIGATVPEVTVGEFTCPCPGEVALAGREIDPVRAAPAWGLVAPARSRSGGGESARPGIWIEPDGWPALDCAGTAPGCVV